MCVWYVWHVVTCHVLQGTCCITLAPLLNVGAIWPYPAVGRP
jgi:hypothetical protein